MATQQRFALVTATSAAVLLALSGCGLLGGDDDSADDTASPETTTTQTEEPTQSPEATATETSSPSPTATETSTSASGAPTDLTNSRVMGALNGQTVHGVQVATTTTSIMDASGMNINELLQDSIGNVSVDPPECEGPVKGTLLGGVAQSHMEEGVIVTDPGSSILITVRSYDTASEAQTEMRNFQTALKDCELTTMSLDDSVQEVELSEEDLEIPSVDQAITSSISTSGDGGFNESTSSRMVFGNSYVTALSLGEFDGQPADYEAMLTEVAELLQDA